MLLERDFGGRNCLVRCCASEQSAGLCLPEKDAIRQGLWPKTHAKNTATCVANALITLASPGSDNCRSEELKSRRIHISNRVRSLLPLPLKINTKLKSIN